MGRKNKQYRKDLHQQAYERLKGMQAFGQSKAQAKQDGSDRDKIYSFSTYQTYWKHIKYFLRWLQIAHPECRTLKAAKKYVNEWLQIRIEQGLSARTIHTETAALCKLFQIPPDGPKRFQPPQRHREDIKRSRGDAVRDKHFSAKNNDELIKFVCATGTRRNVLERLEGRDLWSREQMIVEVAKLMAKSSLTENERRHLESVRDALEIFPDQAYFVHHRRDKNGKSRFAPIIGPNASQVVERMRNTGADEQVWKYIPGAMDVHSYRAEYATDLYKLYAREIKDIPYDRVNQGTGRGYQSDVYVCRKDEARKKLDKAAMRKCSKALGHNRLNVVADNYIRGI